MPSRVTYWTGVWDPGREALSKEVETLRRSCAPGATVVSFSRGQRTRLSVANRVIQLSGGRTYWLYTLAKALQMRGGVQHVFGAANDWHLLRALTRGPILFTVAVGGRQRFPALYRRVDVFAAESDALAAQLIETGVDPRQVRLIYPGVNLTRFAPAPTPAGRFTVLFASTPADVQEFDARGIPLIAEAARRLADVDFVLLWRTWGDQRLANAALKALDLPANVRIERRTIRNMANEYRQAHATLCCFAAGFGKSCPNSVIEGLGCGRPAILSDGVGIARLVDERGAGVMVPRNAEGLVEGIERLRGRFEQASRAARRTAEQLFEVSRFQQAYDELYRSLASGVPVHGAPGALKSEFGMTR